MRANEAKKDGVKQVRCQNVHKSLSDCTNDAIERCGCWVASWEPT